MAGGMHGRGVWMAGGMRGGGHAWPVGCVVGGVCGTHAPRADTTATAYGQ